MRHQPLSSITRTAAGGTCLGNGEINLGNSTPKREFLRNIANHASASSKVDIIDLLIIKILVDTCITHSIKPLKHP